MKIIITDYKDNKKIEFNNNAKGIRDFINLLNEKFAETGIRINIEFKLKKGS